MSLKDHFTHALAKTKYFYATQVTAIPPQKVREVMEGNGWQFQSENPDNNPAAGAAAMGMAFSHHARHVILSPMGKNVYTSGPELLRYYEYALAVAASDVYGLKRPNP